MHRSYRLINNYFLLFLFLSINISVTYAGEDVFALFPEMKSWQKNLVDEVYTPDDLWDYINGAAGGYLSQEFIDLHMAEYTSGKLSLKAEIYQHSDPVHAFGIYTQERYSGYDFNNIGAEGYTTGSSLNFVNDNFYVKIYSDSEEQKVLEKIRELAVLISDRINSHPALPEALQVFPAENKIPYSDAFISGSFLGHDFLKAVFLVKYQDKQEKYSLFFIEQESREASLQMLMEYLNFTKQEINIQENQPYTINDQYNGNVHVILDGKKIFGVTGTDDSSIIDHYLKPGFGNVQ